MLVKLTMVDAAQWNSELVAHLAAQSFRLSKPKVMRIRGLTATNQAGLRRDEISVLLVA
jgi:hypothetical protein